ncbi:SusC/RagA family TonB-linked outer membrane protein [Pedobacter frigiditerrae]|nr:SusC/RagA family TonB-linked outer membrane protein [Pedobacter frigiditerrae]
MKLIAILLLTATMHLSAASYSQNITLSVRNADLQNVFKEVNKQSGYLFFYAGKNNISQKKVSVVLKSATIKQALDEILKDQALTYTIINNTIVLQNSVDKPQLPDAVDKPMPLSGRVVDAQTKKGIVGVNVYQKDNKANGTTTASNGEFKINANLGDTLVFSFIGYKLKQVRVVDSKPMNISLETEIKDMSDVVITGYQTIKKESYTGTAITIKGDDLKKMNSQNLIKSIQSFDPSFKILDNNLAGSDPNALPKINVRGATALPSINDNVLDRNNLSSSYNLPAFIMDGFEVSLQKVTDLDINRIESITLLKDAAATAVYGSRAANGVLVITTKAPIPGRLQFAYNSEFVFTAPDLSDYHLLNAADKLRYEQIAGLYTSSPNNTNMGTPDELEAAYYSKLRNVASGVNTYWLSQPLRNTYGQKQSIFAQGGDTTFRYGVDLRYQTRPGVMKESGRNQFSGGMSFSYNPSRKLLIKNEVTLTQVNATNSKYGDFSTYVYMNPYYPMTDASGKLIREIANWRVDTRQSGADQYKNVAVYNPLFEASLANFDKNEYMEFMDALSTDWKLTPALRLRGQVNLIKYKASADRFVSPLSNTFFNGPAAEIENRGSYDYSVDENLKLDGNVTLTYNKMIKDHFFNVVLGGNAISARSDFKYFQARGFSNDRFTNIGFARTYQPDTHPGGNVSKSRSLGTFFSGNYSYKDKYLMDATFRLDGSSAFGAASRFAPFYAGGLGWNMHKEKFMEPLANVISRLKFTVTGGLTGSVSFPPYLSKSIYAYQTSNWYATGLGAVVQGYGNDNLKWQKTTNIDAGIDIGLFKDRLMLRPAYYYKLTKGLLIDINVAPSTGFTTYKENLGNMENKGYELYATFNAIRTSNWNINFTANVAHNTNTIVEIGNALKAYNESVDEFQSDDNNKAAGFPLLRYNEGQSLNTYYAVKSRGIDPENGKEIYVKRDGSLTYDYDIRDTQPVGDSTPFAEGSFGGNISYKQFMLSFSFFYRFGGDMYNQTLVDRVENADPRYNVDSRVLAQRWQKPGDIVFYKNIADLGQTKATSRFIQKDNQLELRSVYLSYDLKKTVAKKLWMQGLRASFTANDIFKSTSAQIERGIDYPFARSVMFALQATF